MTAQGTPTRRAETTGSVGEADGGPVPQGMRQAFPNLAPDFDKLITANNHFDDLCAAMERDFRHLFGEQSK